MTTRTQAFMAMVLMIIYAVWGAISIGESGGDMSSGIYQLLFAFVIGWMTMLYLPPRRESEEDEEEPATT